MATVVGWECPECLLACGTFAALKMHRLTAHPAHLCLLCGAGYSVYNDLYRHHRLVHDKDDRYTCLYCDRVFKSGRERSQHLDVCPRG